MRPRFRRLALAVRDQGRSPAFCERYLGFDGASARCGPGGVPILRDAEDQFSLAPGEVPDKCLDPDR